MKVLFVNSMCGYASTGRIVAGIYEQVKAAGGSAKVAYGFRKAGIVPECDRYKINSKTGYYFHNILAKLTDKTGLFSKWHTIRFLKWVDEYNPDIVNIHNLHGYYINYELLFDYLASKNKKVVLTLHDCWLFTGHCAHFDMAGCTGYKSGCEKCPHKELYPKSYFISRAKQNYELKKKLLGSIKDLTVVTPSEWLAGLARQSFLGNRDIKVINNGIDLSVFSPIESDDKSSDKKTVLAVSNSWSFGKGFDDINEIADKLPENIKIVMVGLEKRQLRATNKKITAITRTGNALELAKLYSSADVFINLTREDTFPTVNIEALACGTPVITYNTGGSPEIIGQNCGYVIKTGDIPGAVNAITEHIGEKEQLKPFCVAHAQNYDMNNKFREYIKLFEGLIC